jgi:cbb3-type cytochrome oxidase cytochrome c subunit
MSVGLEKLPRTLRRPGVLGLLCAVLAVGPAVYLFAASRTTGRALAAQPASESFGLTAAQAARARRLIVDNSCMVCHKLGDSGGTTGPDLTNYAEREIRAADLVVFLQQPTSWYPSTSMPAYSHLSRDDVSLIANYVCGLVDPERLSRLPPGADLTRGVCGPRFTSLAANPEAGR